MYVVKENDDVSARLANLTRKVEAMELKRGGKEKIVEKEDICGICETSGHMTEDCPPFLPLRKSCMNKPTPQIRTRDPSLHPTQTLTIQGGETIQISIGGKIKVLNLLQLGLPIIIQLLILPTLQIKDLKILSLKGHLHQ